MRIRSFTYMRIDRPRSARGFAFRLNLIFFSCPFINFYCVVFVTPYPTRVDKIFLCNSCATGIDTVQLIPVQFEICIVWLNLLKLQRRKLYQQNGLINKVLTRNVWQPENSKNSEIWCTHRGVHP
ncbi:uncharacterized protein LOC120358795 [Solenopsis invicta]|uniref:uncharacterized protein LOC120358795 n=1 Tax=Solenopsis invicta TaxID=13686 RepID=UPI00193CC4F4|nr:uncharacterized protein LOC120358795 [Solenopsis invicta]